jgi:hypothetical protein
MRDVQKDILKLVIFVVCIGLALVLGIFIFGFIVNSTAHRGRITCGGFFNKECPAGMGCAAESTHQSKFSTGFCIKL